MFFTLTFLWEYNIFEGRRAKEGGKKENSKL